MVRRRRYKNQYHCHNNDRRISLPLFGSEIAENWPTRFSILESLSNIRAKPIKPERGFMQSKTHNNDAQPFHFEKVLFIFDSLDRSLDAGR
ncbi:MAG: hypothetical protein Q9P14_13325 [candidate division KSB1 bacterium]|nr:hypothetical protein [candidate division KSB1 bacterium]